MQPQMIAIISTRLLNELVKLPGETCTCRRTCRPLPASENRTAEGRRPANPVGQSRTGSKGTGSRPMSELHDFPPVPFDNRSERNKRFFL